MKKYLLLLLVPLIVISCKKNPGNPVVPVSSEQYFPPKAGNYWVYEEFKGDTLGNFLDTHGVSDSIYCVGDTSISGKTYHVFCDFVNTYYWLIWRDSSGYMVDQSGRIQFSAQNLSDTLRTDSSFNLTVKYKMINNIAVSTPAGSFNTLEYRGIITSSSAIVINPKYYYAYNYSLNTGMVMFHTFYLNAPNGIIENRLIRYHLE
jgi:hypothetical protein